LTIPMSDHRLPNCFLIFKLLPLFTFEFMHMIIVHIVCPLFHLSSRIDVKLKESNNENLTQIAYTTRNWANMQLQKNNCIPNVTAKRLDLPNCTIATVGVASLSFCSRQCNSKMRSSGTWSFTCCFQFTAPTKYDVDTVNLVLCETYFCYYTLQSDTVTARHSGVTTEWLGNDLKASSKKFWHSVD